MKKTYHFLQLFSIVILVELLFTALLGGVSFGYLYDAEADALPFPHVIIILFALMVISTIGTIIYVCVKAENVGVSHIKKTNKFILFADAFAVIMMLTFFIYECVTSMTHLDDTNATKATIFFRVLRWIISIPALGYFVFQALPKKIKRIKIAIPTFLKAITSVSVILWCILGVFTTYFATHLTTPGDVTKISMMFVYAIFALFFILEGEFELIRTRHKPYMISAFVTSVFAFAFPFGISIAKIFRSDMVRDALSQPELVTCVAIGIYSLAKMFALVSTMKLVIENRHGSHSSRRHSSTKSAPADSEEAPVDVAE